MLLGYPAVEDAAGERTEKLRLVTAGHHYLAHLDRVLGARGPGLPSLLDDDFDPTSGLPPVGGILVLIAGIGAAFPGQDPADCLASCQPFGRSVLHGYPPGSDSRQLVIVILFYKKINPNEEFKNLYFKKLFSRIERIYHWSPILERVEDESYWSNHIFFIGGIPFSRVI